MEVGETKSSVFIDGAEHAWCIYKRGTLPQTGFVGFGVNQQAELEGSWSMQRSIRSQGLDMLGDSKLIDYVKVE